MRWLGGGSGAGKTTVARRLAARYGLTRYGTDDVLDDHARRARGRPAVDAFVAQNPDERWVQRTPQEMLDTFPWFAGEGFDLVVADLAARGGDPPVLAEGFRLLPDRVAPLLGERGRAVWLLPTPEFRRRAFESRPDIRAIAARTSDPARAWRNLLERDRRFTERLRDQVRSAGLVAYEVDLDTPESGLVAAVAVALGLEPPGG